MDFNILMNETVTRARSEMDAIGYEQLTTPEQVEVAVKRPGTTLFMVNSVCGCAAELHVLPHNMQFIMTRVLTI